MKGARFKVYQDDADLWRWRLQSVNGRILADSGEAYTRKADADRAVKVLIEQVTRIANRQLIERIKAG